MLGIETAVGIVVASYLSVLTVVLTYLGWSALGADAEDAAEAQQMNVEGD